MTTAPRDLPVSVRGLCRSYSSRAGPRAVLIDLDLEVSSGEMVAVVGRSGSGKTTLLNILAGFDSGFEGQVRVGERRLGKLPDRELSDFRCSEVGVVLQGAAALESLSLLDNVVLPSLFVRVRRPSQEQMAQRGRELLAEVGLADRSHDRVRELSGGELQRLALARALMNAPPVLLCDEPTGNLDRATATSVVELLERLRRDHALTIVVATHDDLIEQAAGRMLVLVEGRLRSARHEPSSAPGESS